MQGYRPRARLPLMPPKKQRATPEGFVKTSYELRLESKRALRDLTAAIEDEGYQGLSETAVIETLILTAKRSSVDRKALDRVLKARQAAAEKARR